MLSYLKRELSIKSGRKLINYVYHERFKTLTSNSSTDSLFNKISNINNINGDRINELNSLVSVNVPEDINPNYRPSTSSWNGSDPILHSSTAVRYKTDCDSLVGKKKTGMSKIYSGVRRYVKHSFQC